jgi:hypothetical protein
MMERMNPESAKIIEKLPFDRECPKCGAKANELCRNEQGLPIRGFHSQRWPSKERPAAPLSNR